MRDNLTIPLQNNTNLDLGLLNKVVLRFKQRFWPKTVEWMLHASKELNNTVFFLSLYRHCLEPVLIAFLHGELAKYVEKNEDHVVFDRFLDVRPLSLSLAFL